MANHLSTAERHAGEKPALLKGRLTLPEQDLCRQILQQRYLQPGERHREDLFVRVAHALAQAEDAPVREQWASRFKQTLEQGGLVAGRILAGAGTGLHTTLVNCFVQPVGDCILGHDETGHPGIYEALGQAAETLRRGGGGGAEGGDGRDGCAGGRGLLLLTVLVGEFLTSRRQHASITQAVATAIYFFLDGVQVQWVGTLECAW